MQPLYRMPLGFGPSLGPRQGPDGRRFTGELSRATLLTAAYRTDDAALAAVMPPGFRPADDPLVTVRVHHNHSLAWLGGKAYDYIEVMFRAVFEGERDREEGDLIAVMWETSADAVVVGRDECGHPKLFADIAGPTVAGGATSFTASSWGHSFLTVTFDGLELTPWPEAADAAAMSAPPVVRPGSHPRMNYKYIPNSEDLSRPDAAYAVFMPSGLYEERLLESWTGTGRVDYVPAPWPQLPIFANVVDGLAALPVVEWGTASMVRVIRCFNDLRDAMRILR